MVHQAEDREPADTYRDALSRGVPFRDEDGRLHYPTMRSRPQPSFTLDLFHRALLMGSLVVSFGYTVWMVLRIPSMPELVPMHFSADGSVNRYASPWEMLILMAVMMAMIIGLAVLTRYPRIFNYGVGTVTDENIQAHYKNAVQLMIWTVLSMAVLHIIALGGIAGDWSINPGIWFGMAILLGSAAFFILRMTKL